MRNISITAVIFLGILVYAMSFYYSDKQVSEREYQHMLDAGQLNLVTLQKYLAHHTQETDAIYNQVLQHAASLDGKYLAEVIDYYTGGQLILTTRSAHLILQQLPSDSSQLNHAAGNIYATEEFGLYQPHKAVKHLEFAALRGNWNAAATLSRLYARADCKIEAVTWAREANRRDITSECTSLPIDITLLSDDELDATEDNESELLRAEKEKRLPVLKYSEQCSMRP